jgi:hypothetical protein
VWDQPRRAVEPVLEEKGEVEAKTPRSNRGFGFGAEFGAFSSSPFTKLLFFQYARQELNL